jgi:ferredoxin/DNA-binding transcriptional ArsR family regulator
MCLEHYRLLAKSLNTPPMFADVLPLIARPDEADLLLRLHEEKLSVGALSKALGLTDAVVESKLKDLYMRGFLTKEKGAKASFFVKPFERIIARQLGEGKANTFGRYASALADYRMTEHVKRTRTDAYPEGKVLPILGAVVDPISVVLPYETAVTILEKAQSISIRDCACRVTYRKCDKPLRTCLAIGEFSDDLVERGAADEISVDEGIEYLKVADRSGLVHQALYTDWVKGEVFDICSCCPCCCVYLRAVMDYGVKHTIAKSGLVAKVDGDTCAGCGVCVDRCVFHARKLEDGKSVVDESACYGCGLCTTSCRAGASRLVSAVRQ